MTLPPPPPPPPYTQDYVALDLHAEIVAAGFQPPKQKESSPLYCTVVAVKA